MLRNYFLLTLRNIRRQPGYTLLNILGLTIGITSSLFILLFIIEETRFDSQHEKADRIYRISSDLTEPDDHFRWSVTQLPLANQLKEDCPEVESSVRLIPNGRTSLEYEDQFFYEEKVFYADSTLFDIFTLPLIQGNKSTALTAPRSVVLSERVAQKIFGKNDPMGKVLKTLQDTEYKVTGVFENMPNHSHLIAEVIFSSNTVPYFANPAPNTWGGFNIYTYALLNKDNNKPAELAAKLPKIIETHVATIFDEFNIKVKYEVLPLRDIHLKSDFEHEPEPTGQIGFLYIFGIVALLMLALACINYMNLSTARATKRATEVGIRKVLGSERWQLIAQFLSESIFFTTIALLISFALIPFLLPVFNETFGLQLSSDLLITTPILASLFGILAIVGVLGGSYPAFFLSAFKPITVLKGNLSRNGGNQRLRKVLVGIQFAITLFMLIGTGIIYDQMNYLRNKNLGFDKENVMVLTLPRRLSQEKFPILSQKLLANPKFIRIGSANNQLGGTPGKLLMNMENSQGSMEQFGVDHYGVDYNFFSTVNAQIVQGRDFDINLSTDSSSAVLVNESMVKRMAWDDPIGKRVQFGTEDTLQMFQVIGVVQDFHQQSLYEPISPLLFYPNQNNYALHARIQPENSEELAQIIAHANQSWKEVLPNSPFDFEFVDEAYMDLYEADQIRARIFTLFSVLMIFVACLGLLGLASFIAEQRTKEVGIRKILGAETPDIVFLLTKNFLFIVSMAAIPAFLLSWYFMKSWLQTFAYSTSLNFWLFLLAFLLVIIMVVITTGYHALRASSGNPVDSLRYE
ncbi:MAG: ABC transporter permease [Bacteroidota bacterium]